MTIEESMILLAGDSPDDALFLCSAFDRAGLGQLLRYVGDGQLAIAYLNGDGIYADRGSYPLPTVLLLDLSQAGTDGLAVLAWIALKPQFKSLRIYLLGTSSRSEDIALAYDLGASAYLVKPGHQNGLTHQAKVLITWLKQCHYPVQTDMTDQRKSVASSLNSVTPFARSG